MGPAGDARFIKNQAGSDGFMMMMMMMKPGQKIGQQPGILAFIETIKSAAVSQVTLS